MAMTEQDVADLITKHLKVELEEVTENGFTKVSVTLAWKYNHATVKRFDSDSIAIPAKD